MHSTRTRPARFQSTLPMRGATCWPGVSRYRGVISIHAPHAGSDWINPTMATYSPYFNPRSPCGERPTLHSTRTRPARFQSTLPMRGATCWPGVSRYRGVISIHAPHAGSDWINPTMATYSPYFNPRSPCGERLHIYTPPGVS